MLKPSVHRFILKGGRGQAPLRHAIRIGIGRALKTRESLVSSLIWGVGVGLMYALSAPPKARGMAFFAPMLVAFTIGYFSTIPWRWSIWRGRKDWLILLTNGVLALVTGYCLFFLSLLISQVVFMGPDAVTRYVLKVFSIVSIGGFIFAVMGYYIVSGEEQERRERRIRRQTAYQQGLAEQARNVALRAQINPHFFFNSLNTIAALIPERPADAERAVELLATALRPVLMRDQPLIASLDSELRVTEAYAEMEKLRLGARVRFVFEVDDAARGLTLPSMVLQPLVENAVRHGASLSAEETLIGIRARIVEETLELEIRNGPAREADAATEEGMRPATITAGHALHNIGLRLKGLYGPAASLQVRHGENPLRGLTRLRAPVRTNHREPEREN
jgi:sensor histidine kinase YesM